MNNIKIPNHQKKLNILSQYLREIRFNENLSQIEVSNELDLHYNTILRAENGKNMTILTLFELADFYEIQVSELFSILD